MSKMNKIDITARRSPVAPVATAVTAATAATGVVRKDTRATVAAARKQRRNSSDVERKLWHRIRDKQIDEFRFRRQRPIGKYIVDFVCLDAMLILELAGGQHAEPRAKDELRTVFLESLGYRVARFWDNEVIANIEGVLEKIREELLLTRAPTPPPALPFAGEGADRANAAPSAQTPSPAPRGKGGMGVRSSLPSAGNETKGQES